MTSPHARTPGDTPSQPAPPVLRPVAVLASALAVLLVAGALLVAEAAYARSVREAADALLSTIARGHAISIGAFVRERFADASLMAANERTRRVLATPAGARRAGDLDTLALRLRNTASTYGFSNLEIVDAAERPVVFLVHDELAASPVAARTVQAAMRDQRPLLIPLGGDGAHELEFGVVVPVIAPDGSARVVGAVLGMLRAEDRLLADLRGALVEGGTMDATMLQPVGDSVLIFGTMLTDARGERHGILRPATDTANVGILALARGTGGLFEGVDYRGVRVRAHALPIPGTPWVAVAKLDAAETDRTIRVMRLAVGAILALLLVIAAVVSRLVAVAEQRTVARLQARLGERALRVVQTSIDAFVALDRDGRLVECNDAAAALTGYTPEELVRLSLGDLKVVDAGDDIPRVLRRIRESPGLRYQSRWRHKDGHHLDVSVSVRYLPELDGGRFLAFVRDITEDLRAQRQLERRNRLYAFLNHASEALVRAPTRAAAFEAFCRAAHDEGGFALAAISVLDPGSGRLQIEAAAGAARERLLGIELPLDTGEAGLPTIRAIRERRAVVVNDYLADPGTATFHALARELGVNAALALPVVVDDTVVAALMLYARPREFFGDDEVAILNETGRFLGLVLAAHASAEVQRREEARFRAFFDSSPLAMSVMAVDGAILRVNDAFRRGVGYDAHELPAMEPAAERLIPDPGYRGKALDVLRDALARIAASDDTLLLPPLHIRAREGHERIMQGHMTRVGGEVLVGWVDLTELRRSQELATEAQEIARLRPWEYDFDRDVVRYVGEDPQAVGGAARTRAALFERFVSEDRELVGRHFDEAVERRAPLDVVARYRTADGAVRHMRVRGRVEYDGTGRALRMVGSNQDVTEETLLARELELHRESLERLVEARTTELARANAQLLVTDRRLKAMLELSRRATDLDEAELFQLGIDEAVRLTGSAFGYVHLIDDAQARIAFNRWSSGTAEACGIPYEAHYPLRDAGIWADAVRRREPVIHNGLDRDDRVAAFPDGHPALHRHLAVPLVEGERVRLLMGVANKAGDYDAADAQELELIARDVWAIVQRRRTESALTWAYERVAASDERFAFAMEASAEGIWDWDLRTDQLAFSNEYLKILGYAPSEFPGTGAGWFGMLHEDDRERLRREAVEGLEQDRTMRFEFRIRRRDGTYVYAQTTGKVVERDDDGRAVRAVGTFRDLSAQRAAEQELRDAKEAADEANRAKSAFLAVMSHEIRTPLNGVIGMAEILAQSPLPVREADAVRTIRTSATNLLTLIDDILDFSKIEAGRLDLELVDTDLHEVLESIVAALGPVAATRHVDLGVLIAPEVPRRVRSDATRLRQIVFNLVGNAIKFSAGRVERLGRVLVTVSLDPADAARLRIRVRDNGIGIAPEAQARLFSSFVQAEASTTRRYGGTGLGLAICKRLTDLLEGRITVESTPGVGSTFTVELPVAPGAEEPAAPLPDLRGLPVIIVRHEGDLGEVGEIARYLAVGGADTAVAGTLEDAQAAARARPGPAVVIQWTRPGDERGGITPDEDGLRYLRITHGQRRAARVVAPNFVVLDHSALRHASLLRAVAIAAGRASPEQLREAPEAPVVDPAVRPPSVAEARRDGRLILVAEDDEINQKVILRQLELLGYAAEVAGDGLEALAMWRRGTYAMLITDLHMPEMDGYALTDAVRASGTAGARLPILALTANALRGEEARARAAGMDEYLTKPIRLKDLKRVLAQWLHPEESASVSSAKPDAAAAARRDTPPAGAIEAATEVVLDVEVLKRYVGDDPAMVREFLVQFRDATAGYEASLRTAQDAADHVQLGRTAHSFKSAARAVGALALGEQCAELEQAAKRHDADAIAAGSARLVAALALVRQRIDAFLAPVP